MTPGSQPPPTEPIPPQVPPTEPVRPRAPVVREPVAAAYQPADPLWLERIDERLRSLSSFVAVLAVVSLAALGLSIYSLLQDDGDGRGASRERVANLDDRVERLEGRTADAADSGTTSTLASRLDDTSRDVSSLSEEVAKLRSAVSKAGSGDGSSTAAVTQLSSRVDRLAQDVADLSARAQDNTTTTP